MERMKSLKTGVTQLKKTLSRRLHPRRLYFHFHSKRSAKDAASTLSRPSTPQTPPAAHFLIPFDPPPVDKDHNSKIPISRLPAELLAAVFILACETSEISDYSWVFYSHVCALWRHVALDTPRFWSHIVFDSRAWMQACIERAKSSPLIIATDIWWTGSPFEERVFEALALSERIRTIKIRCFGLSDRLSKLLAGPFPVLTDMSIETDPSWFMGATQPFHLEPNPLPDLKHLLITSDLMFLLPALSGDQLVFLEINGLDTVSWEFLAGAVEPLVALQTLKLHGTPTTSPSNSARRTHLPALEYLTLASAEPTYCTGFIQTNQFPKLKECHLQLRNATDTKAVVEAVLGVLPAPKSMFLERKYGSTLYSEPFPPFEAAKPGFFQHAVLGFAYTNLRTVWSQHTFDISFAWHPALLDSELATLFTALSEISILPSIKWLMLVNWNSSPMTAWTPLLKRLTSLQTILISGIPPSGLFWDLLKSPGRDHGPDAPAQELFPALTEIQLASVDCGAGSWRALRTAAKGQTAPSSLAVSSSYFDRDGARFIEVLICYLESRERVLPRLLIRACINYTGAEIKLLRRLVDDVTWDGAGRMDAMYYNHSDEFFASTINHELLAEQPGYEVLRQGGPEWYKEQMALFYKVRSTVDAEANQA